MTSTAMHRVLITETDFDVGVVCNDLRSATPGEAGALVTFIGLVRERALSQKSSATVSTDADADRDVVDLELQHYPGMTERSIEKIVDQARARWSVLSSVVHHRVGRMSPSDQIVLVAVTSAHRADAFDAATFIMDYLKTDAVLWKKEVTSDSDTWIEATNTDIERVSNWQLETRNDG